MQRVFVGSDETGYYREPNEQELRREVARLEHENDRLRNRIMEAVGILIEGGSRDQAERILKVALVDR